MRDCVDNGLRNEGILPGGLNVQRRAARLHRNLQEIGKPNVIGSTLSAMEWVNLFALAVNEENAAGGRMVTAPTNGAAGIIPAVLHYYMKFNPDAQDRDVVDYLLAAAAVGILCKKNASISGAEVGCQGEVGSACAMAAAGLAEPRRHPGAGRERCRDRSGTQPRADLRPGWRAGPGALYRAQRDRRGEGHQRGANGLARRRPAFHLAGQGDPHHARHRRRHARQVQGNLARGLAVNAIEC